MATQFFETIGRKALMRNIQDHPQILTGDPEFDTLCHAIFARILAEDPRVLKWDDNFIAIVGLYDQATRGDIPKRQRCKEPNLDSGFGKVKAVAEMALDGGKGLIDKYRRFAHTKQVGKPREQAIEEFKELVLALYRAEDEKAPGDIPLFTPSANEIQSGTLEESKDGSYPGTFEDYTPSDGSQGLEMVDGESQDQLLTGSLRGDSDVRHLLKDSSGVAMAGKGQHQDSKIIRPATISSTSEPKVFSKEWWTPTKGVIVAAAAGAAISLIAGSIFLFNKMFIIRRRTRDNGEDRKRRLHAREWNQG